jgi:hypothetical protein
MLTVFDFCCRPEEYKKKVMDYVKKFASEEALRQSEQDAVSSSSESSMSDFSEDEAQVSYSVLIKINFSFWQKGSTFFT